MARTIDFPDELMDDLKKVADAENRSVNATLIVAAREYVESRRHRARVLAATRKVVELDGELLERLAQ